MIRFPKMHIAESVVNRIMNANDDLESSQEPQIPNIPVIPDPTVIGAVIENQATQPTPEVTLPSLPAQAEMTMASAMGDSPFNGALLGATSEY